MRTRFIIFTQLFFSIFCGQIHAQNLFGIVKNENNEPIISANIKVLNTTLSTISDENGKFQLTLNNPQQTLNIAAIGYASVIKKINIDSSSNVTIILKEMSYVLDEIVVTGQKTEESIISADIAISSFSAEKIQQTNTRNIGNLVGMIPNYQYADVGVPYQQQLAVRGVSVFSNNPTVATYVDGVNSLDISANGFQLVDIERIEVLRGPQGTLYGRNAMGGVINIITKKPTNKTAFSFETSTGNQGLQRYGITFKTPLLKNKLFFGLATQYQFQQGFYGNDTTADFNILGKTVKGPANTNVRFGDAEAYYANVYLRWFAHKNLDFTYNFKYQLDKSVGPSSYFQAAVDDSVAKANLYKFTVNRFGTDSRSVINNSLSSNYQHKYFNLTSISAFQYIAQKYDNIDFDYWTFDIAFASSFHNKVGDGIPQYVFSEELRINSNEKHKRLKWTLGTYLFKQLYDYRTSTTYIAPLASLFGYRGIDVAENNQNNTGLAFFGQASFFVTEKLSFTAGLRFDNEQRQSTISQFNIDKNGLITYKINDTTRTKSFQAFSPKLILSYKLKENQNLYLSYTRGFRAGGINTNTKFAGLETFKPEFSDNYELAYKYFSTNKKLFFTSTFFYMNWRDLQLDYRPDGVAYITANIGNVRSKGLEFEANVLPIKNLQFDLAIGLNDAQYYNFSYLGTNLSGKQTIMAPKTTLFLATQYSFKINSKIKSFVRFEWRGIGNQYFDLMNKIKQPAYNLFNARVGANYKNIDLALWCQNIINETYLAYAMPAVFRYSILNRPRSLGVTLTYKL